MNRLTPDMVLRVSVAAVLFTTTFIFTRTILFPDLLLFQLAAAFAMGVYGYCAPLVWNHWSWPFGWILLIPIVTVFWSDELLRQAVGQGICTLVEEHPYNDAVPDIWRCPREDALPTLLPGLLNLVAFSWVLSGRREVRWAALVAGTLGAVRLTAPLLIYGLSGGDVEISSGGWFGPSYGPEISASVSLWLWILSAASAIAFLVGANMVDSKKRKRAAAANQARAQDERARLLTRLRDEGLITDEEFESKRPDLPSEP